MKLSVVFASVITLLSSVSLGVAGADSTLKLTYEEEPIGAEFLREAREELARARRGRQLNLGPRATFGYCWLATQVPSTWSDDLDAAECNDVGLRFTYPFVVPPAMVPPDQTAYMVLEVDVMGGWTGDASFNNVIFEDERGVLTRSAKYGRVTSGLVLRVGDQIIPYFRIALGLQVVRVQSEFGGFEIPDEYEIDVPVSIGLGLNVHLGNNVLFGASINGGDIFGGGDYILRYMLNAGLHLSYAWNP